MNQTRKRAREKSNDNQEAQTTNKVAKLSSVVRCPRCPISSQKRFKLGRSLRMHVESVHWPCHRDQLKDVDTEAIRKEQAIYTDKILREVEADSSLHADVRTNGIATTKPAEWEMAAKKGNVEWLKNLKARGKWRFDTKGKHGAIAEHWAAGSGHLECLKYCILERVSNCPEHGESQDQQREPSCTCRESFGKRKDGRSALHWAARNGHNNVVKYLVDQKEKKDQLGAFEQTVDCETFDGTTPLMLAVLGNHVEVVKALVNAGADVSRSNRWGCTLSHWAGLGSCPADDHSSMMRMCSLLHDEYGIRFDVVQKEGHSAVHKAAFKGNRFLFRWIRDNGVSSAELKNACNKDNANKWPSDIARMQGFEDLATEMKLLEEKLYG